MGHPQEYTLKVVWWSDLIWLRYIRYKNVYLFICLFVCFWTGLFFLNQLGTPTRIYPENFMKIPLDLAEILRIRKLDWKCLFFCLFIYSFFFCFNHHRIPTGSFPQNFVKIRLGLAEILRISKLDWRDGGGRGGRREAILLCN